MSSSAGRSHRGSRALRLGRAITVASVAVLVLVLVLGAAAPASAVTMVRRFCNVKNGSHFWSASGQECADIPLDSMRTTFNYEGISWAIKDGGNVTVYRAYNTRNGAHFYTAGESEYNSLPWYFNREGPAFTTFSSGTVVYRYYYTPIGSHFYTSNPAELAGNPSFRYEGPAFCVQTTSPIINAVRRWPNNTNEAWPTCRVYVNYQGLPNVAWKDAAFRSRMEWNNMGKSNMYFTRADSTGANQIVTGREAPSVYAMTRVYFSPDGSSVVKATTTVNTVFWLFCPSGTPAANEMDLEGILTHELGHWVVEADPHRFPEFLGRPEEYWPWATMHGFPGYGWTHPRTLAAEDIDGIRALYGLRP